MQIRATFNGQKYDLPESGLADMVAFERQFKQPASVLSDAATGGGRIEYLMFLVYRGLKKLKVEGVVAFDDDFLEAVTDLEVEGEDDEEGDDEADPTVPAVAPGS